MKIVKPRGAALSVLLAVCAVLPVDAQLSGEVNSYIANAPIAVLPRGPYAQWTEPQRQHAITEIGGFCKYLCIDSYGNASFPNPQAAALAAAEVEVCLGACIVNHLPADFPSLASLKQQLRVNYGKATKLGSKLPWPLPEK